MNARPGAWAPVGQEGSHRRRKGSGYFDTTRKIPLEAIGFYGSGFRITKRNRNSIKGQDAKKFPQIHMKCGS